MVQVHVERVIDVPIERAWEILADFSHVHKIHPLVGSVEKKSTNSNGMGAIRTCHLYDGNRATEEITSWDAANRKYTIRLLDSTLPMKAVDVALEAHKVGETKTKLVAEMILKAKFGLLGKIMERLVIKPQLGGAIGNLFAGVEAFQKTGVEVKKGFKATTPALVR